MYDVCICAPSAMPAICVPPNHDAREKESGPFAGVYTLAADAETGLNPVSLEGHCHIAHLQTTRVCESCSLCMHVCIACPTFGAALRNSLTRQQIPSLRRLPIISHTLPFPCCYAAAPVSANQHDQQLFFFYSAPVARLRCHSQKKESPAGSALSAVEKKRVFFLCLF